MQIDELLKLMVNKGASDLHLTVPSPPVLRIDGVLTPQEDLPPMTAKDVELALEQVSTQEQRSVFDREWELDCAYTVPGLARFRVNVLQQRGTMSLAFRLVPFQIPSIDELALPQICKELILKQRGLILVTGSRLRMLGLRDYRQQLHLFGHLSNPGKKEYTTHRRQPVPP